MLTRRGWLSLLAGTAVAPLLPAETTAAPADDAGHLRPGIVVELLTHDPVTGVSSVAHRAEGSAVSYSIHGDSITIQVALDETVGDFRVDGMRLMHDRPELLPITPECRIPGAGWKLSNGPEGPGNRTTYSIVIRFDGISGFM